MVGWECPTNPREASGLDPEAVHELVPEYFFEAPAASTQGFHNPFTCHRRGLWIHTLMVSSAYHRLASTPLRAENNEFDITQYQYGQAACLLHDVLKYGSTYQEGDSAAPDHAMLAYEAIRSQTELPYDVARAVASHMGPYDGYDGYPRESELDRVVHNADMMASTGNVTPGVFVIPREIRDLYPNLPGANLE